MVDVQVNVTNQGVEETTTENTFVVAGDLTTFEGIDIRKTDTSREANGAPEEINYDFAVSSSGAAAGVNVNTNHRSLTVGPDVTTDTSVTDFFTSIANTGELHVIQRVLRNGDLTYDLFYTNAGTGLIDAELVYRQLTVPPGEFPTVLSTAAAVIDVVSVFREYRGSNRVYDVFVLEGA